ncbi:MAG TPA: GAF domain-containing SpoIIE family protein phosphatase [Solirubrobacterales bacterium]|jgi:serine phosphatase RsbU (regulator of sigma subunit)
MPLRDRELITPPPTLASLQELSGPALIAMLVASAIAVLDGLAGPTVVLIGLLAIPPVIAAMSASLPETAVVGAFCLVLALLSILWHENVDAAQYLIGVFTVVAGDLAGLWVASLRVNLNREQASSELLAEAGALMEDALDRKQRAQHLADLAVPTLGDVAMVDMVAADGSITRVAAGSRGTEVADVFVKLRADTPIDPHGPHPVAEVIRTGRTIYLDQLSDKEIDRITTRENERELLRKHRFKSCIVLPLGARGSVLGALTLWIMRPAKAFDETARRTAKRLADRAALALDNARLHEQQSHIASVLQHSLLPRSLPEISGFETSSRFLAAGEAYEVGGDFYDVFRSGSGTWTAVIGDVCGKGPEAASLTALARYTVRTASSPDSAPSDILRTLHESIRSERADLRFCTAALARIQTPSNGRGAAHLTVALGGHPLPLVLRKNGRVDSIGEPGTLLGALPSPVLADADADLAVGDSLILYTDGMLDVRDRSERDDPDWLPHQLATFAGESADEIAEHLAQAAIKRHGGEPRDDIAILVLHRNGAG